MSRLFGTVGTNILLAVLTAITSVVVARLFGAEVRGQFATVTAVLNTSVSIAVLGTPAYLARLVAASERGQVEVEIDVYRALISLTVLSSLIAILIVTALNIGAAAFPIKPLGQVAIVIFIPLSVLSVLLLNISLGQANWASFNLSRLIFAGVTVGAIASYSMIVAVSLSGLIVCLAVANVVAVSTQLMLLKPVERTMAAWYQSTEAVIVRSRGYALNSILNVSGGYADFIVLSYVFTPYQVGLWAVARSIAALLSPVNTALSMIVFSAFARKGEKEEFRHKRILSNFLVFNVAAAAIIFLMVDPIVEFIFGAEFVHSTPLVPYALMLVAGASFSELIEEQLRGRGRPGPVNISRSVPIFFLLWAVNLSPTPTEVLQLVPYLALGQWLRGLLAVLLLWNEDRGGDNEPNITGSFNSTEALDHSVKKISGDTDD